MVKVAHCRTSECRKGKKNVLFEIKRRAISGNSRKARGIRENYCAKIPTGQYVKCVYYRLSFSSHNVSFNVSTRKYAICEGPVSSGIAFTSSGCHGEHWAGLEWSDRRWLVVNRSLISRHYRSVVHSCIG